MNLHLILIVITAIKLTENVKCIYTNGCGYAISINT